MAQKNPDAIRAAKRLMAVVERGDNAAILQAESDEQDRLVGSPHQREAVLANMQKRAPRFEPAG
ncbi:enoyl-CoA hydratase [compost metagenome]